MRKFLVVIAAILVAYLFLHVLRSFAVAAEARGICAGVAGYLAGDGVASMLGRRSHGGRRSKR